MDLSPHSHNHMLPPGRAPALLSDLPQPGQWTEFSRDRQVAFLEALADSGSVRAAARSVAIGCSTAYRARRADPAFRAAWTGALIAARVLSEDALATRAIDGVEEDVMYRGEVVATRRRYDSRLLLAHLARLDKLTEDARGSAFADDFESALGRFAAGEPQPDPVAGSGASVAAASAPPTDAPAPADGGSCCSGQCANRAKSYSEDAGEELEVCPVTGRMLSPDDCLRNVMAEERPAGARWPDEFPGYDEDAVEAEQMEAFGQGIDRWWLVVPPGPGDATDEWVYFDEGAR